nr:hypothetical protein [Tanacetum cinerariifolium]
MTTESKELRREIIEQVRQALRADVELMNNLAIDLNWYLKQMRIRTPELLRVEALPDDPLDNYGFSVLERSSWSDMTNSANLIAVRNELKRSITSKNQMINQYRTM